MSIFEFVSDVIDDLMDVDFELTEELTLEELDLASLDYIEIQVLVKKKYGVVLSPELFESGQIKTLGDFATYIEENKSN